MKYASAGAFRAALECRLKCDQTDAIGISRLRKRVAFERLLARLAEVAHGGWYLKGGFALELRLGVQARSTKDVDIDSNGGEEGATELLLDAAACDLRDWFSFEVHRSRNEDELAGGSHRWTARAVVAGREFERVAVDVGFDAPPVVAPDSIPTSDLLDFARIAPVSVPALSIEQHLAEKLHAYSRIYAGDRPSSRVKDLVDIMLIAETTPVPADRLSQATAAIFERRDTHSLPGRLPEPPDDWDQPWETLVEHLPAGTGLEAGFECAAAFWDPVLRGSVAGTTWEPRAAAWIHG